MTKVVNIKNSRCDVYIGRAGRGQDGYFGNPFRLGDIDAYNNYWQNLTAVEIRPLETLPERATIITKGAFYVMSEENNE
ncbi:hypothetical protein FACS1894162_2160 [Bacteroidia bacterium]|nr:hypothetical protein FACS1894162_2160 [Bacteroidia bacterium]